MLDKVLDSVLASMSAILGTIGVIAVAIYNFKSKKTEVTGNPAAEWKALYQDQQKKSTEQADKIDELYRELSKMRDEISDLRTRLTQFTDKEKVYLNTIQTLENEKSELIKIVAKRDGRIVALETLLKEAETT